MERELKLYSYFRSSAAYRVRIALNLKKLEYQQIPVNLLKGEQLGDDYRKVNPVGLVPALVTGQGILSQSLAIMEWLEENYPQPAILPEHSWSKARVRAMAYAITCDIHPLNNVRVIDYLKNEHQVESPTGESWYHHWVHVGFQALEQQVEASPFCFGDTPTFADICLIPQVYNAQRFQMDMSQYPKIFSTWNHCKTLEAFTKAAPEKQPDSF
ncbi:maleylacetoacetate isomerase [Sansalvadorimonas sp. 2012CJ34-2]|uniref:Maleylacetoacetate isomerase n=1 Tax=Parendozoicomonas callyspongiae TaxID=2942213 RepID=A0ABT0PD77_9GAMM|nr:maleylacetoacetate isomerase [Sansalvadorimonas sp. 2012CJ34-2]MCL6268498.1 maleylacetoacetate isomerase [Sansalvadorimonas sp. 2012CJ34-2]